MDLQRIITTIFYFIFLSMTIIVQFATCNEELKLPLEASTKIVNFNCKPGYKMVGNTCRHLVVSKTLFKINETNNFSIK